MPNNEHERELLVAALIKWANGEPLSMTDFNRVVNHLNTVPLQVEQVNQDELIGAYARLVKVFSDRYQQQQQ